MLPRHWHTWIAKLLLPPAVLILLTTPSLIGASLANADIAYMIRSKLDGNVIDVLGGNTAPATPLDAYPSNTANGSPDQLWTLVPDPAGSGYYFIQSFMDGDVIDIEGGSTAPGAPLDAYPMKTTGTENQLWNLVSDPAGSGYFFIQSLLGGSKGDVIDIEGASTAAAARLDAYPMKMSGYDNQLWELLVEPTTTIAPPVFVTVLQYPNDCGEGTLNAPGAATFAIASSGQTPPQTEVSSGVYLVTVASGTALTLAATTEEGEYIVNPNNGGATNQIFSSTYGNPATIYVRAINPLTCR